MTVSVPAPVFTSMGMFIIDDNHYPSVWNRKDDLDVIGGGGSYAIVGARVVCGLSHSSQVCGIIDKGGDFPASVERELDSWKCGLVYRVDSSRSTTRGVNVYDEKETRDFYYKTDKKRIEPEDIVNDELLSRSSSYHLLCSVERCKRIVDAILTVNPDAIFIYEPLPDACLPENYEGLKLILGRIDVLSPNVKEASMLADVEEEELPTIEGLETLALKFRKYMTKPGSGVVIRCGAQGCYVSSPSFKGMLPAYHGHNSGSVVDVTGGGNAFCGGFVGGLVMSKGDWQIAGICGNLASGCVIEQLGMPSVSATQGNVWNGTNITVRFKKYVKEHSIEDVQMSWIEEDPA